MSKEVELRDVIRMRFKERLLSSMGLQYIHKDNTAI